MTPEQKKAVALARARKRRQEADGGIMGQLAGYGRDIVTGLADFPRGAFQLGVGAGEDIRQLTPEPIREAASTLAEPVFAGMNAMGVPAPEVSSEQLEQIEQQRRQQTSSVPMRMAGNIATGSGMMRGANMGGNVLTRMLKGGGTGAGFGAVTPATSDVERGVMTGAGAGIGAAIPGAGAGIGAGGRIARNVIDPALPGGVERTATRAMQEAAGPQRATIARLLRENKQISGGASGSGEVAAPAGRAEFSALQRFAESKRPSQFAAMEGADKQARVQALRSVGRTPQELQAAEQARTRATSPLYEAAETATGVKVQAKPVISKIDEFLAKNPNEPNITGPLSDIKERITADQSPRAMISLSRHIRDLMGRKTPGGQNEYDVKTLNEIKNVLDDKIADAVPEYGQARQTFAEMSQPINQMQTGQFLEQKLVPALQDDAATGPQRAAMYTQALRDAPGTLKRATGFKRYENLSDVLTPEQVGQTKEVAESLGRRADFEKLSRRGTERGSEILGEQTPTLPQIGMFNPKYSVLRSLSNRLAGRVQGKSMEILMDAMENPQQAADILERIPIEDQPIVLQALSDLQRAGIITAPQTMRESQ